MNFTVLLRKELQEQVRTYRLLIVSGVGLALGLATPLMLKYLPLLVPADQAGIQLPEFSGLDAVRESVSSMAELGLLAAILLAMGGVAKEVEAGTAAMTLTKPAGRGAFVAAKLTAISATFFCSVAAAAAGCYLYTAALFGTVGLPGFLAANALIFVYLVVCLAVTLMYSAMLRSQLAAGGLALVSLIGLGALNSLPALRHISPGALPGKAQLALVGDLGSAAGPLIAGAVLIAAATIVAWQVLQSREL